MSEAVGKCPLCQSDMLEVDGIVFCVKLDYEIRSTDWNALWKAYNSEQKKWLKNKITDDEMTPVKKKLVADLKSANLKSVI